MRNARAMALGVAACLALGACRSDAPTTTVTESAPSLGQQFMTEAIAVMQANSINRRTIDWQTFRTQVLAAAAGTPSEVAALDAMRLALQLLGDGHSFFRFDDGRGVSAPLRTCAAPDVTSPVVPSDIGYVRISGFSGDPEGGNILATSFHQFFQRGDTLAKAGWIVDLRGNTGGNMWPMLASVGPLLGDGVAGHFIDPLNQSLAYSYADGSALLDGVVQARPSNPYRLKQPNPRVAVLLDNLVASSGEAVAVAFKARPNTRFFGSATCGLSTANAGFRIRTGTLFLTVSTMADRNKALFGGPILPDEELTGNAAVERAITWLRSGQ